MTDVMKKIGEKRLRWFGHVKRMGNNRLPKTLVDWQLEERNRRGKPKKHWSDDLKTGPRAACIKRGRGQR